MSNCATIVCYNDGKEEHDSFRASFKYDGSYYGNVIRLDDIYGYGFTQEEAIEDLRKNTSKAFDDLQALVKMFLETDALPVRPVDCFFNYIDTKE